MAEQRPGWTRRGTAAAAAITTTMVLTLAIGSSWGTPGHAQPRLQPQPPDPKKANEFGVGGRRVIPGGGGPNAEFVPRDGGAINRNLGAGGRVRFKVAAFDRSPLAVTYYPSRQGPGAAVVVMVHDLNQTAREFETPIPDQNNVGLAEILQKQGYAVVLYDARGQGGSRGPLLKPADLIAQGGTPGVVLPEFVPALAAEYAREIAARRAEREAVTDGKAQAKTRPSGNRRKSADPDVVKRQEELEAERTEQQRRRDRESDLVRKINDLQAIYYFLIDRHNRGEFNLGKLAVIATGDGANLAAAWAATPQAAVAAPRPLSDLSALVLVSPKETLESLQLADSLKVFASRVPTMILTSEDHAETSKVARDNQGTVERNRRGAIALIPSSALTGARLIRFEKGVVERLVEFLDATVKFKVEDWEPRYNLQPVGATRAEVAGPGAAATPPPAAPDAEPAVPKKGNSP